MRIISKSFHYGYKAMKFINYTLLTALLEVNLLQAELSVLAESIMKCEVKSMQLGDKPGAMPMLTIITP